MRDKRWNFGRPRTVQAAMVRTRAMLVGLVAVLLTGTACASRGDITSGVAPVARTTQWRELSGSPLTPRGAAIGIWTGREVLLIGGSDAPPCPPTASCSRRRSAFRDGAAVDPETGRWRRLADSPVPLADGPGVVVGRTAYILEEGELLAYRVDDDEWDRLPAPPGKAGWYALVAAGDTLVAHLTSDEAGPGMDFWLDRRTRTWVAMPPDPLGKGFNRGMAWTGEELILFDQELVPNPGADGPCLVRAAAFDLASGSWRRLPDSRIIGTGPWLAADGVLVNPSLGGADGGRVGNWGRTYPYGGRLDPATGTWSSLPSPPAGSEPPAGSMLSAGARGQSTAVYLAASGLVLDTTNGRWLAVPNPPDGFMDGRAIVAAGTDLLVFGGAPRSTDDRPYVNRAWIFAG